MPKESQPVILRTSASADGWWAKMADAEVNKSFRVLNGQISLFTDCELKICPFADKHVLLICAHLLLRRLLRLRCLLTIRRCLI